MSLASCIKIVCAPAAPAPKGHCEPQHCGGWDPKPRDCDDHRRGGRDCDDHGHGGHHQHGGCW